MTIEDDSEDVTGKSDDQFSVEGLERAVREGPPVP